MPRALRIGKDTRAFDPVRRQSPDSGRRPDGLPDRSVHEGGSPLTEIKELIEKVWDWWMEEGKNRERLGELIKRQGFQKLLEVTGTGPDPQHGQGAQVQPLYLLERRRSRRRMEARHQRIPQTTSEIKEVEH